MEKGTPYVSIEKLFSSRRARRNNSRTNDISAVQQLHLITIRKLMHCSAVQCPLTYHDHDSILYPPTLAFCTSNPLRTAETDISAFRSNFAITREPLKLRRHVEHCKKVFFTVHLLRYWRCISYVICDARPGKTQILA